MEHIRLTAISLSLLLCTVSAFSQRHYENIPALELNYGTNLFGNAGNYYNLSFSRYINRTSYWKAGLSYFEKPYEYTPNLPQVSTLNPEETIPETIHDKGKDFYVGRRLLQNPGQQPEIRLLEHRPGRIHRYRIRPPPR